MTAAEPPRHARLDAWERREPMVFALLPYVMLAASTVLNLLVGGRSAAALGTDVALAAVTAGWMLAGFTLRPARHADTEWRSAFVAVLVALMAALVLRSPVYGFFSFTGYFYAYRLPIGRRAVAVAAVAVVSATSQAGGLPSAQASSIVTFALIVLVNVGLAGGIGWFAWVGREQDARRRRATEQLRATNSRLESSLAEVAALQAQLVASAREAGIRDERQRMAGEIHDTLAQSLAGILTSLEAAECARDRDRQRHLDAAKELAREGLTEARRSVQALTPPELAEARLPDAVATVADRWSKLHGVPAAVRTTGEPRALSPELEVALLRTAQEALANVAKHARATRVGLTLSYMADVVALDVRDDGVGFTPSRPDPAHDGGFGLPVMRQRIGTLAGEVAVESTPGGGTAVCARVPTVPARGAP